MRKRCMLRQDFHGWRVTGTGGGWPELIVNPLLSSPGGLSYFKPIWGGGGLIETVGGLFNLETTMISVLHKKKKLEYKVEKLKYKKF